MRRRIGTLCSHGSSHRVSQGLRESYVTAHIPWVVSSVYGRPMALESGSPLVVPWAIMTILWYIPWDHLIGHPIVNPMGCPVISHTAYGIPHGDTTGIPAGYRGDIMDHSNGMDNVLWDDP